MAEELSEYDKYNTLNNELNGPVKPKPTPKVQAPKVNKYEALRQSGVESSVIGRNMSEVNKTDDGPGPIVAGENVNESRAFNQSATENMFSGLSKGTGLLGTTLVNTFIGLPLGIAEASYTGLVDDKATKGEAFSKVYDNEVTNYMEKFNQGMERWFPNYYSEKEQKANVFSWENLGSSNFWGDKVLKNTGFTAGAILGGGLVSKGIRGSSIMARMLVGANELSEGALLAQFNTFLADGVDSLTAAKKVATGVRALNQTAALATSTIVSAGEASSEALQAKNELKKSLDDRWREEHPGQTLDDDIHALHNQLASKAGNATFGINMALLMGTETFQFGKLWAKGFTPELKRAEQLALKDGVVEVTKPTFIKKAVKVAGNTALNGLAESFEEGIQTAAQAATKDYYGRIYDKDAITENSRASHAVLAGLQETFGSRDGLESMLLGAITGIGSHAATSGISTILGKARGLPNDEQTAQIFAKQMNEQFQSKIPFLHAAIRAASINKDMEANAASMSPSRVVHENLSHDNLKALVQPFIQADRFDLLEDKLTNELSKDDEQFKADHPDVDTKKTSKEYVGKIIKDAKRLKDNWDNIEEMFPKVDSRVKERLWSLLSDIQNKDDRSKALNLEVFAKSGVNFDGVEDYLNKVQAAYDKGNVGVDIKKAQDVVQLAQEKDAAVQAYKDATQPEVQAAIVEADEEKKEELANLPVTESGEIDDKPNPTAEDLVKERYKELATNAKQRVQSIGRTDARATFQEEFDKEDDPIEKEALKRVLAALDKGTKAEADKEAAKYKDDIAPLVKIVDSGDDTLDNMLAQLDEVIGDADYEQSDREKAAGMKAALERYYGVEKKVEQPKVEAKTEKKEEELPESTPDKLVIPQGTFSPVVNKFFADPLDPSLRGAAKDIAERNKDSTYKPEILEVEAINKVLAQTEDAYQKSLAPTPSAKVEEREPEAEEHPDIIENDSIQSDYSEMDRMAATASRSTANHEDAIKEGLNSVLRYQNFLNNPANQIDGSGLQLMVVTPQSSLYKKLLNKKQSAFEDKRAAEGKQISGILVVVVDSDGNLVVTDTSGALDGSKRLEPGEFEGDVDNELEGVLVTTLVSNPGLKESGYNAVSYQHFGRKNGFSKEESTEENALNPKTAFGAKWKEHVDSVAKTRADINAGKIKYLSIESVSPGIFQNTGTDRVETSITEVFPVDLNSDQLQFVVPKIEEIGQKGLAEIGDEYGVKPQLVKVGKPYVIYNGRLYPLNTRRLNAQEVEDVAKLLELAISKPKNQVFYLGKVKELTFLKASQLKDILEGNLSGDNLRAFLAEKYRQIDAAKLQSNAKGKYGVSKIDGRGVSEGTDQTYRDSIFLGDSPALTVNMKPHPTTTKDSASPNFLNGYIEYSPAYRVKGVISNTTISKEDFSTLASASNEQTGERFITMALDSLDKGVGLGSINLKDGKLYSHNQTGNSTFSNTPLTNNELDRFNKIVEVGKTISDKFSKVVARVNELIADPNSSFPHGVGIQPVKDETLTTKYGLNADEIKVLRKNYGLALSTSVSSAIESYSYFLLGQEIGNKQLQKDAIAKLNKSGYFNVVANYDSSLNQEEPKQVTAEEVATPTVETKKAVRDMTPAEKKALREANQAKRAANQADMGEGLTIPGLSRRVELATSNKKENVPAAQKWFQDRFNGESFEVVNGLIRGNTFGEYTAAATRLFSGAEEGTIYHESFHKVTQEYLTPKQVKSLYDGVRKNVNNKFTDLQAEEWLAEEFRKFVLNGQKAIKNMPYTNNIFRKLYNWIKSLVTGKTTPQQVFDRLASKKGYTGAKRFDNQQFTKLERAIPGLTHQQTKDLVDSVNSNFFNILFKAKATPNELFGKNANKYFNGIYQLLEKQMYDTYLGIEEDYLDELYTDEEFEAIKQHYSFALNFNENDEPQGLNDAVKDAHKEILKSVGIYLVTKTTDRDAVEDLELEDEDSEKALKEDSTGRDKAEWGNANEENTLAGAPNSIKMLVMSLPRVDADGQLVNNAIGGVALNDYNQTMKLLYTNLNGVSTFHEMYAKLQEISVRFPVMRELLVRLGESGSNKTQQQFLLENDFRQAFHKFESRGTITLINQENGEIYQVDANANKLRDRIQENWTSNLRGLASIEGSYVQKRDDGQLAINQKYVEDARAGKFKDNYKGLLEGLGITFTDLSQEQVQQIPDIKTIANTIFKYVAKAVEEGQPVNDLFSSTVDIKGQLNKLLDVEQKMSKETIELSYLNAEGKRIYAVSLNNYATLVVSALNRAQSLEDLYRDYPHFNNPYTRNSLWLESMFDEDGKKIAGKRLYLNTISGAKLQDDNESGVGATSMEPSDKIMQEFADLLTKGTASLRRAGDKSSEYAPGVSSYANGNVLAIPLATIPSKGLDTKEVRDIFLGYFKDELERIRAFTEIKDKEGKVIKPSIGKNLDIYNKNAGNFSLFADMLTSETLSELEVYKTSSDELSTDLEAKIGKEVTDYLAKYAKGVKDYMQDRQFALPFNGGFTGVSSAIATTEDELNKAIKCFAVNHLINMVEQSKLIIGDSAFYKDIFKRISAFTGTKKFAASSKHVDNWLNGFYKDKGRVDGKEANGRIRAVIFADNKANSDNYQDYVDALEKSVGKEKAETILDAYNNMDEGDAQGWITLDEYREFSMRVGGAYWTEEHEKQYQWEVANERGENAGENPGFYFMPIKAQYAGPQMIEGIYAPAFHKYSLAPLYHSLVKGRNMETLLNSMREKQVGYALFGSGSKVGTPLANNGKLPSFYGEEGVAGIGNQTPIQEIYYQNLGIQLDIAPKVKDKNIFGSQFRKLLFSNALVQGTNPIFTELHDEYLKLIDEGVTSEFDKLVKKLGIKAELKDGQVTNFSFKGDYRKLVNELKKQLEDKDTADNILDSLQVNEDGSLVYPIDGLVNRGKIESMLFSIVNSKVIKQKTLGNALVQLASSGFESKGKREVGKSNYLKFYTNKGPNGTTTSMEVEIPMNETFRALEQKYGSIDALNEAITKGEVDQKMLTMVGYRIPTQGLNSMDFMTIKRFLPESSGISIILPTEVVAKSGGDYDIDKLNIFMPHIFYDEKRKEVGYNEYYNKKGPSKEGRQNRILEIATEVLSHPDNFNELITPNSTAILTDVVAKIRAAEGKGKVEKASTTREFRFDHIMEQFSYFLGGKAALGIAATHNTHHILSQIAKVKFNTELPFKSNTKPSKVQRTKTLEDGSIQEYTEDIDAVDLSGVYSTEGTKINDVINQFINAYVDVAKDPFYKDLNAGTEVASIWFYLVRAGVDVETIAYFMTQPIIKEYVRARKLNKSLVVKSSGRVRSEKKIGQMTRDSLQTQLSASYDELENAKGKQYDRIKREIAAREYFLNTPSIAEELIEKMGTKDKLSKPDFAYTGVNDVLLKHISEGSKGREFSREFREAQTQLLKVFLDVESQAGELTSLMQDTNNDTTKLQNYGSVYKREQAAKKVRESAIIPSGTSEAIKKQTIVGSFDIVDNTKKMFAELTLYMKKPGVKALLDGLIADIPKGADFEKEYTKIQNDFIGYITQKFGKTIEGEPLISKMSLFTGDDSLATQLVALRKEGVSDIVNNPFVNELVGLINGDTNAISNIKLWSRRMTAHESNIYTEAFRELLDSNEPRIAEFGRNLAYLSILQSGLQNSPITFTELVPFKFYGDIVKGAIDAGDGKISKKDFLAAYEHKKSSRQGYRLQDFGLENAPVASTQEDVLPLQDDSAVDTGNSTEREVDNPVDDSIDNSLPDIRDIKNELTDILWQRAIDSREYTLSDENGKNERTIIRDDIPLLKSGKEFAQNSDGDVSWRDILQEEFYKVTKKGIGRFDSYSEAFSIESLIEGVQDNTDKDYESNLLQFNNVTEILPKFAKFNPSSQLNQIREVNKLEEDSDNTKQCKL